MKLLITLLLTLLLAAGCNADTVPNTPIVDTPTTPAENPITEPPQNSSEFPAVSVETEPDTTPDQPSAQEPESSATIPVVSTRQALDSNDVLFYIPANGLYEDLTGQTLLLWNDLTLVSSGTTSQENKLSFRNYALNLSNGSSSIVYQSSETSQSILQSCGNTLAILDWDLGSVLLQPSQDSYQIRSNGSPFYLSTDAKTAYILRYDSGIWAVTLSTGEESCLFEAASLLLSSKCGETVSFSYSDPDAQQTVYAALDLNSGSIRHCPDTELIFGVKALGDLWLGASSDTGTYRLGTNEFNVPEGCSSASLLADGRLLLYFPSAESMTLSVYEADGHFLSSCTLPEGYYGPNSDPVWVEADDGYYLLAVHPDGHDVLLYWDLAAVVPGNDLVLSPVN